MQSLPAVVGQGLQKDAGPVNFPVHKVVQPQISVLQALQRLEGLGNLRYRVLVRRANSQQSPGAGIVDFGEHVAQMPPSILGPAGYKFISLPQDALRKPGIKEMLQNCGLPETRGGLHQCQGIVFHILQLLQQPGRIIFHFWVNGLCPRHSFLPGTEGTILRRRYPLPYFLAS